MNRDVWAVLVDKCESEALQKTNSAGQGEGPWIHIRLHQWFNNTTGLGQTNRLTGIMGPESCNYEYDIASAIEKWKEKNRRVMDEDETGPKQCLSGIR